MSRRMWWGVAIVVVGFLLLGANFGLIAPFSIWGLWPIFVIVPAMKFAGGHATFTVQSDRGRVRVRTSTNLGYQLVAAWIALGAAAQLLHNVHLTVWDWGDVFHWTAPVLLVGVGTILILYSRRRPWRHGNDVAGRGAGTSIFVGDLCYGARPWLFKSPMSLNLWAGDVEIDLTTAQFAPGDNYLSLHGWAGDFDLRVPDNIEVTVEAHCGAGQARVFDEHRDGLGCDLKVTRAATGGTEAVRLFIDAGLSFGNIKVR
jgi:hypothetical protein